MIPYNLSSLVIDGPEESPSRDAVVGAGPSISSVLWFEEIDSVAVLGAHDKQAGPWIEARRAEVGGAGLVGGYQDAALRWKLGRIRNGASLRVDPLGPVHGGKWGGQQTLAIGAVEHEEVAVARCLHHQLARLAVEIGIHQNGNFVGIPIVRIVRRDLEAPGEFSSIRVQ